MEKPISRKIINALREFTSDPVEILELYDALVSISPNRDLLYCLRDDRCFAKFVKEILGRKVSERLKINLIDMIYERFLFFAPPFNQYFLNFLLKKYGMKFLGKKAMFLYKIDKETPEDIVVENIFIILNSKSKRKYDIVVSIIEKNSKLLDKIIGRNKKLGYKILSYIINSSNKVHGKLIRKAVYLMYIKFDKSILKKFDPSRSGRKMLYINMGILDILRKSIEDFDEEMIREYIEKAISSRNANLRKLGYKYGYEIFGDEFLEKAVNDRSKMIRRWAERLLKNETSEDVKKRSSFNADAAIKLCIKYFEEGNYEKSLNCAERLLKKEDNTIAKIIKAEALWKLGDFVRAEAILDEVMQKEKILDAYIAKAALYVDLGDFEEALNVVNEGLLKYPDSFHLNIMKAQILYWLGDKNYKNFVERAREIDFIRTEIFMDTFWIYDLPPTHPLLQKLVEAFKHLTSRNFSMVENIIEDIKSLELPESEEVSQELTILLLIKRGNFKEAEELLKKIEKKGKNLKYMLDILWMELEIERRNYEKALHHLDSVINYAEERNFPLKELYLIKSDILRKIGRYQEAEYYRTLAEDEESSSYNAFGFHI